MKTKGLLRTLLAMGFCAAADLTLAQTWTQTSAPNFPWHAVASSADGTKLVAAVTGGPIFTSTNSGAAWTPTSAPITNWFSVASSADGTKLAATAMNSPLFTSADSGATWTVATNAPPTYYLAPLASSADGNRLILGFYDGVHRFGGMAASTDSGANWTTLDAPPAVSVAASADGTKLLVGAGPCFGCGFSAWFGTSTDAGATWRVTSVPSSLAWNAGASSADGRKLAAANSDGSGLIYTSQDWGATWATNSAPSGNWISIASSADGTKLVAAQGGNFQPGGPVYGGPLYTSTDSGTTWTSNNVPDVFAVASSADGSKLVAVANGGGIYTSHSTPTPSLSIIRSGSNAVISWTVPSTEFGLQQNADLTPTNWTDVTNAPTLNLTNLKNEVVVSPTYGNRFYRPGNRLGAPANSFKPPVQ